MTRILLIDSHESRCPAIANGIGLACEKLTTATQVVEVSSDENQYPHWKSFDVVVLHSNDSWQIENLDLHSVVGPAIVKYGGEGQEEEEGECSSRVYSIYPPIPPQGPYGLFAQADVWKRILRFVLDPTSWEKPAELSARPADPLVLATWLLLKGYALARGFVSDQKLGTLAAEASRCWNQFNLDEKKGFWQPVDGAVVVLADAKLARASNVVERLRTTVEPEREFVLAAMEEVGHFLQRRGFKQL